MFKDSDSKQNIRIDINLVVVLLQSFIRLLCDWKNTVKTVTAVFCALLLLVCVCARVCAWVRACVCVKQTLALIYMCYVVRLCLCLGLTSIRQLFKDQSIPITLSKTEIEIRRVSKVILHISYTKSLLLDKNNYFSLNAGNY